MLEKRTDLQNSVKLIDVTSAGTKRVEVQKLHEDGTDAPDVNSGVVVPRTEKQLGCAVPACRHLVRHVPAAWCSGPALTTRGMHAIRTFARHKGGAAAGVILLLAQSLRPRKAKVRDLQFALRRDDSKSTLECFSSWCEVLTLPVGQGSKESAPGGRVGGL